MLLVLPAHRGYNRTNADEEYEEDPLKAQTMTQTSSPQSNASVRYPVGGIFIGSPLPLFGALQGVA
jgi:hypothetical protein